MEGGFESKKISSLRNYRAPVLIEGEHSINKYSLLERALQECRIMKEYLTPAEYYQRWCEDHPHYHVSLM
jgi:hypothetical protein